MPRRRTSKALKQQLARPINELGLGMRMFLWVFRSEVSSVLTIGLLFMLFYGLQAMLSNLGTDLRGLILLLFILLILGVFLGVVIVTEDDDRYKSSGSRIRMTCGLVAGIAIAIMVNANFEGLVLAGIFGAALGYFGIYWVKYC